MPTINKMFARLQELDTRLSYYNLTPRQYYKERNELRRLYKKLKNMGLI